MEMGGWHRGEEEARKIWKVYLEDLYNIDTQEDVAANLCGFDGIRSGNYFGGEPIGSAEVEVRVGKLKNGKATGKDEITGEMIKLEVTGWWIGSGGYVIWPLEWCCT